VSDTRTLLPFRGLVDNCWSLLRGDLFVSFPTSSRSHPSREVCLQPIGYIWPGDFWEGLVVPTLDRLLQNPPTYQFGWRNPLARGLVEAYLRRSLTGSVWSSWVDFSL
jgi:hypothetical protein